MATYVIVRYLGKEEDGVTPLLDWANTVVMRNEAAGATQEDLLQRGVNEPGQYVVARVDNIQVRMARTVVAVDP